MVITFAKTHGGRFTLPQVKKLLASHRRPASSASPVCAQLIKTGVLRRMASGDFKLLAKKKPKTKAKKAARHNGKNSAGLNSEAAANG
jgi:hypothetical protein